jgi:hypothetical protein
MADTKSNKKLGLTDSFTLTEPNQFIIIIIIVIIIVSSSSVIIIIIIIIIFFFFAVLVAPAYVITCILVWC